MIYDNKDMATTASVIAEEMAINVNDLYIRCRLRSIVEARQMSMYIMRSKGYKLHDIGRHFKRDHATAIHAINKIQDLIDTYPSWKRLYNRLCNILVPKWRLGDYIPLNNIEYFCLPCIANPKLFTTFTK